VAEAPKMKAETPSHLDNGEAPAKVTVLRGAGAQAVADKPRLTGDPEFDAIELQATSPDAEPFPASFLEGL